MTKQDEYRFNLKFDEADEDHRRVSEFLNKCGRKKARYIVKAVLAYWELQSGKTPIVERSAKTHISLKETVILKDEPDRGDRLIQVKAENNNGLDQEEADLMRQNYAVFEDIE